jgi:hypothetical protein
MSCLDATFTLTPRSPYYSSQQNVAELFCFGADFYAYAPDDLSSLYASNQFLFDGSYASDPNLNYASWLNRAKARQLLLYVDLGTYVGAQKQLALIFGFDVVYSNIPGRVLVYSDAGLLQDQQLAYGDNQFMLELESVDQPLWLYFIHAGGYWYFKGLSGYVV